MTVYAVNQADGGKSVEKEYVITPVIDPDDVVYPDVEYVTFQATIKMCIRDRNMSYSGAG